MFSSGGGCWGPRWMQEPAGGHQAPAGLKLSLGRGEENLFHFGGFPISQPLRGQEMRCGWEGRVRKGGGEVGAEIHEGEADVGMGGLSIFPGWGKGGLLETQPHRGDLNQPKGAGPRARVQRKHQGGLGGC